MGKRTWAGAAVALLLAAGCGSGGGGGDGVATLTGADSGEDAPTTTTIPPDEAMLRFVRCMREHGVDMPDPDDEGRVMIRREETDGGGAGVTGGPEDPEFQAAEEACADLRPQMSAPSEEELAEMQDRGRAMAECLREHGFDVPDPEISRGPNGGIMQRQQAPTDFDPDDPEFREAEEVCRERSGMDEDGPPGPPDADDES